VFKCYYLGMDIDAYATKHEQRYNMAKHILMTSVKNAL
jgi:hypothetical protein